uniref:Uncharacterized protein AlNc14C5G781 n=1 Tax=Albugo laibachii Nc14 TaxID=890382 RepID=F0W101_9STRA|nr:conserved hypothetical protein [Albugo laibachii Nc14]|eukprot:CCA14725.1 conserved hypothetical protein [Albugo laibachii Nc14]
MAKRVGIRMNVVGTGSDGSIPSVLFSVERYGIYSDDVTLLQRYLFNCGEGTQRICKEYQIRVNTLNSVFLTQFTNWNVAGIPGLIFALGECGASNLHLYGPNRSNAYLQSLQSFVRRRYPALNCTEIIQKSSSGAVICNDIPDFRMRDKHAQISAFCLRSHSTSGNSVIDAENICRHSIQDSSMKTFSTLSSDSSDFSDGEKEEWVLDRSAMVDQTWLEEFYSHHHPEKKDHAAQILRQFSGREHVLRDMLIRKYCDETASTTTPLTGKRKRKRSKEISPPKDKYGTIHVSLESSKGDWSTGEAGDPICYVLTFMQDIHRLCWIITCPHQSFVFDLIHRFKPCAAHFPMLIVHLTPENVLMQADYAQWMNSFTTGTKHLTFDSATLETTADGVFSYTFKSSALAALRRKEANFHPNSNYFQLARYLQKCTANGSCPSTRLLLSQIRVETHLAQSQLLYWFHHPKSVVQTHFEYEMTGWKKILEHAGLLSRLTAPPFISLKPIDQSHTNVQIVFLGTGCAAPSKLRGSSGIYLDFCTGKEGFLLDCGEGTFGNLCRHYGRKEGIQRISNLCGIWISHHHADHQAGIVTLLEVFAQHSDNVLLVIAPESVLQFIRTWQGTLLHPRIHLITCRAMNNCSYSSAFWQHTLRKNNPLTRLGILSDVRSVPVHHCYDAFGVVLTLSDGRRLLYSGDTRPCNALVEAGQDVDLLIHEATFEDTRQEDAIRKRHSTVSEAMQVARKMRARRVVLTHFSAGFPFRMFAHCSAQVSFQEFPHRAGVERAGESMSIEPTVVLLGRLFAIQIVGTTCAVLYYPSMSSAPHDKGIFGCEKDVRGTSIFRRSSSSSQPPLLSPLQAGDSDIAPIYKFVLTGGPCAGKTTSLERLSTFFRDRGFRVYIVPEASTLLQTGGALVVDLKEKDILNFQWQLLKLQMSLEDSFYSLAMDTKSPCVILCDRGAMDGSAYMSTDQWEELKYEHDLDTVTLRDTRYIAVFHLVTAAKGAERFYSLENNGARQETLDQARIIDERTCRAWVGHPKLFIFDNSAGFEKKMQRLIDTAAVLCGIPTTVRASRKFLLRKAPLKNDIYIDHEDFEVEKVYLQPEEGETSKDYSFVRCRTQYGISAYGMTTVRYLDSGEMVHLKRVLNAREYSYAVRRRVDTSRHIIKQQRICFLYECQSVQIHVYKDPFAINNLAILHLQASEENQQISVPSFVTIERELYESDDLYSAHKISLRCRNK